MSGCDPDPYYQQGGDMVRVGGLQYACDPTQKIGNRISSMTLKGKPVEAGKSYKLTKLGAGGRRRLGRAGLGCRHALSA